MEKMRKIIFRGKRIDNGKWVHGDISFTKVRGKVFIDFASPFNLSSIPYEVDADTVGQFTGLYDKNGKEIYEGDILKHDSSQFSDVVAWDSKGYFYIKEKHILLPDEEPSCTPLGKMIIREDFVVIGNIHNNPGLLKGGEE